MIYAGIGSRETPQEVLSEFKTLAIALAFKRLILRSGRAEGADSAFEDGCDEGHGKKEIYLPWPRFNNSTSTLIVQPGKAFEIAETYHPAWSRLPEGAKKLHARNSHQILGWELDTPADFIVCWTKGGKMIGGTSQALRLAKDHDVVIFNFGGGATSADVLDFVNERM